ncbi:hypothetical protein JCM19046_3686 [Bacillus sp. JCM 19046]|nr:hypothetical protein JCM19046_3686 [Bacillus sp. JCM 19046]
MKLINPTRIIPLSTHVEKTLLAMKLPYPFGQRLAHPYYSSIGKRDSAYRERYYETLKAYIREIHEA